MLPTVAHVQSFHDMFVRLMVGAGLGVAIGFEREWRNRGAGLQTTGLVATGAALFCVTGPALGIGGGDSMRVVQAVAQGVGFLAGGVILKEGLNVTGLNTAATLWATAAVGALAGVGLMSEATVGALSILALNLVLLPFAEGLNRRFTASHPPSHKLDGTNVTPGH
jgi:putative Mg2+ transporter-C (MgtC) family protein